jgi:hypothetical protein
MRWNQKFQQRLHGTASPKEPVEATERRRLYATGKYQAPWLIWRGAVELEFGKAYSARYAAALSLATLVVPRMTACADRSDGAA